MRSERGREGRSRSRLLRSELRSFAGAAGGGGVGTGARSPGLIPAFSAAAVGRNTLTCRDGIAAAGAGRLTSGAPLVGTAGVAGISNAGAAASCATGADRKSTRLNSSHGYISYAVFCLKKK